MINFSSFSGMGGSTIEAGIEDRGAEVSRLDERLPKDEKSFCRSLDLRNIRHVLGD